MTRILYAHNSADLYGASRSLLRMLGRLDRTAFSPLVVLPEEGPLAGSLRERGERVIIHPSLSVITRSAFRPHRLPRLLVRFPFSVWFLRRLIARERIDLVHTNTGVIFSPALAARCAGVPHVWHVRDWFQEFGKLWGPYSRYITGCSDRVLAVSEAIAGQFADRRKVEVLHNGFDLEEFAIDKGGARAAFREAHGIPSDALLVGCVGRIKLVRKGQEVFVEAAARLAERGCGAWFMVVGSPAPGCDEHLAILRRTVTERGLEGRFVWAGELADPRPAYAAMDLFVLPSSQPEPFGGVVMEAMAMGLPVVATNIGGSPDQVAEGETGFLVPPRDPEAMADAVGRILGEAGLREQMGGAGPERIVRVFSLGEKVRRIEGVYREVGGWGLRRET